MAICVNFSAPLGSLFSIFWIASLTLGLKVNDGPVAPPITAPFPLAIESGTDEMDDAGERASEEVMDGLGDRTESFGAMKRSTRHTSPASAPVASWTLYLEGKARTFRG